ncbi:multicopper oxidase [Aulographum hederae CBS 113979]|uniref:Multicopper oxidase n=1 Tax=Aulographum hederae CBS 113979 TaxID=1176131 RepID=A0A6G1HBD9_9PEZI|nr:multicopper oxidase [Aulographum hederae CBS 113979]
MWKKPQGESPIQYGGDYVLDPTWDFDAAPKRREYTWTIEDHDFNPDGVYRPMMLVNRQFPGPLIECNEGDTIVVHVENKAVNATSIHWHGLYQNGTNHMDGTIGITQCPIAPSSSFTYEFKVDGQSGTYWYHSHQGVQTSDGLLGPFVIHSRDERRLQGVKYSTDHVVMLQDHYHDTSSSLLMDYLKPDQENAEPVPDGALINGRAVRNCDDLPDRRCDNSTTIPTIMNLPKNASHRLRIINVGAFAEFQVQIDEQEFAVTEVDGTDVNPAYYHRLNINPAQRYSIVISPDSKSTSSVWLRARMIKHCFAEPNPHMQEEVRGIINFGSNPAGALPSSKNWDEQIELECRDLNTTELHPVVPLAAPPADTLIYLRSNFEIGAWRLSRGFFNTSSFRPSMSSPSLHRVIDGYSHGNESFTNATGSAPFGINSQGFSVATELVYQTTDVKVLDILVDNFDDGNHPLHLHGYKFFVLAQGHGYFNYSNYESLNVLNPLRRDTASVEAFGWTLLRVVLDNPGMWAFHCHVSWHAEAGLLMQFLVDADTVGSWKMPQANVDLCERPGIERGGSPKDEIWYGHFKD